MNQDEKIQFLEEDLLVYETFFTQIGKICTSLKLNEPEKLRAVRLSYMEIAFPDSFDQISSENKNILDRI